MALRLYLLIISLSLIYKIGFFELFIVFFLCSLLFIYLGADFSFYNFLKKVFKRKNFNSIIFLIIKLFRMSLLLATLLNTSPAWPTYVDYIVETGLEDNEKVNEAVDALGLTNDQKYYLKIGCVITGVIFSILFGYYITKNYEIFKPVESYSDTESVASLSGSEDLNIDAISIASTTEETVWKEIKQEIQNEVGEAGLKEQAINIINNFINDDTEETVFREIPQDPQPQNEVRSKEEVIYIINDSEEAVLYKEEIPQEKIIAEVPKERQHEPISYSSEHHQRYINLRDKITREHLHSIAFDNLVKNIKKKL